jgi:hypothetical protein
MMSPDQARVVDPVLTEHARGYSNAEYVGGVLFPSVTMPTRAAKRIEFDRSSFRRRQIQRAPGARIAQIQFGYEGKPVSLIQRAIAAKTPVEHMEEAQEVPGLDLQQMSVDLVLATVALDKEISQAETARNAAAYAASNKTALAGADKWSDPASRPKTLVFDAKETIRRRIGRRPNTMLVGGAVASKLQVHPQILENYKYTAQDSVTMDQLRRYFEVDTMVAGDAIYDLADGSSVDIWGNDVILAWVPPAGAQRQMGLPSYGYTYQLRNHPFVAPVRWDGDTRSWLNDCFDEFSPELVGADAGFLIQGAI